MLRTMTLISLGMLCIASPALASPPEAHSGTVAAIDPARHALTVEEMGPWTGPGKGTVSRTIALRPDTTFELLRRSTEPIPGGWPNGYVATTLAPDRISPGDFVTVRTVRRHGHVIAVSVEVVEPSGG